jgi:putative DNA primase/helicase
MGGLGKTFTLCDIAARVSRGLPWPDGPDIVHPAGQVLFVSGEDDPEDTLVPRLIELGADLGRVCFLKTEVLDRFSLADLKALDEILSQIGPEVRLVAIDPPTAFLGTVDDHKNAELRGLLSPLKSWAFRQQCAVIFNTHLNKGHGNKVEALTRVMGSVAWVNAVRAAFLFVRDPDDEKLERRFFVPMKMNLAREKPGLAYRIQSTTGDRAKVEWLGEINLSADEAVIAGTKVKVKTINAAEWLIERFREKREWPSTELFQAANQDGIKRDAVFEAKRILELPKAKLIYSVEGKRIWVWWVPDDWVGFERPYDPPS